MANPSNPCQRRTFAFPVDADFFWRSVFPYPWRRDRQTVWWEQVIIICQSSSGQTALLFMPRCICGRYAEPWYLRILEIPNYHVPLSWYSAYSFVINTNKSSDSFMNASGLCGWALILLKFTIKETHLIKGAVNLHLHKNVSVYKTDFIIWIGFPLKPLLQCSQNKW